MLQNVYYWIDVNSSGLKNIGKEVQENTCYTYDLN